jgi:NitT/TauT family transport system permease protein
VHRARGLIIPLVLLAAWETLSRAGVLPIDTMSRPSAALAAGWAALLDGSLAQATLETLQGALIGLLLAALLGIAIGLVVGLSALAETALAPSLELLRPVPPVALIPLSLLLFGFGVSMEAAVVAFACVWPIFIATIAAVRSIEPSYIEVARVLQLSPVARINKIVLPSAFGRIGVGIRVAAGIALVVAVTVEIVVNPRGLGYSMVTAQQSLRSDLMYAGLLWIGAVGWLLNFLLIQIDRTWLRRFVTDGGTA